jgi:hypothetical protein
MTHGLFPDFRAQGLSERKKKRDFFWAFLNYLGPNQHHLIRRELASDSLRLNSASPKKPCGTCRNASTTSQQLRSCTSHRTTGVGCLAPRTQRVQVLFTLLFVVCEAGPLSCALTLGLAGEINTWYQFKRKKYQPRATSAYACFMALARLARQRTRHILLLCAKLFKKN